MVVEAVGSCGQSLYRGEKEGRGEETRRGVEKKREGGKEGRSRRLLRLGFENLGFLGSCFPLAFASEGRRLFSNIIFYLKKEISSVVTS
jgi:hypothetical protein